MTRSRRKQTKKRAHPTLKKLFAQYGVEAGYAEKTAKPTVVSLEEAKQRFRDTDTCAVLDAASSAGGRPIELAERLEKLGTPGTLIRDGKVQMEQSTKARPFVLRGKRSKPGDLEDYYRTDPVIRDSVDSVVEVQMGVDRKIQPPDDELVPGELAGEMGEWVDQLNGWFFNLEGGFNQSYVFPATQSACIFGFSPFEIVWAVDDEYQRTEGREGLAWPVKLGYRETSTLEEWLMSERQDDLLGAYFETGGDADLSYTLTHTGPKLTDQRLLLARIAGRGNNWEGISPIRPAIHWIRFKRLLGQIAAVAAQKYGVPMALLEVDPAMVQSEILSTLNVSEEDIDEAINQFDAAEAVEAGVFYLPPPLTARVEGPQGTMPTLEDMIRYCDEMITRPFSNEGSLLGHNHVGSYALAQVSENKFLRSAPAYDRVIMAPINDLIRKMTIQRFGRKLPAYPQMSMKLNAAGDVKELINSISTAMAGVPMTEWPKGLQQAVLDAANLPGDALDDALGVPGVDVGAGEQASEPDAPTEPEEQKREFNGAQISSMAEVVQQVAEGTLPKVGAIEILKLGFGLTEPEAQAFFVGEIERTSGQIDGDAGEGEQPTRPTVDLSELPAGLVRSLEEFKASAEDVKHFMDESESRLAGKWRKIAREQQREFRDLTEGINSPTAIDSIGDDLLAKYKPRYLEAAREESQRLRKEGAQSLMRELGLSAPRDMQAPELPRGLREQVDATLLQAAKHANSRNVNNLIDQKNQQTTETVRGGRATGLAALSVRALSGIAKKITGRSFNGGRDGLIQSAVQAHEVKTGQEVAGARSPATARGEVTRSGRRGLTCVRSSMLDDRVCEECLKRDFENGGSEYTVGTAAYYDDMPPEPCEGREKCRCAYIYDAPADMIESVAEYVDAQLVI